MGDFTKLELWKLGHVLMLQVYQVTRAFPDHERYGLTAQLRRAASSINSNIAEGAERNTPREFARFLRIALGSGNEVHNHLLAARDLGYIDPEPWREIHSKTLRVKQMLFALIRRLETAQSHQPSGHG